MDRGVTTFVNKEFLKLLDAVDWNMIPDSLQERLASETPEKQDSIRIFLSEEDAEKLLDSIDLEKMKNDIQVKNAYEHLQKFLSEIREKKQGLHAPVIT